MTGRRQRVLDTAWYHCVSLEAIQLKGICSCINGISTVTYDVQDSIDIVTHDVQDNINIVTHNVQDSIHIVTHDVQDSINIVTYNVQDSIDIVTHDSGRSRISCRGC